MLDSKKIIRQLFVAISIGSSVLLSSCDPAIWQGIATGLAGVPTTGQYYTPTTVSAPSSYSSGSSTSTTSKRTCSRCKGTGSCTTCGGSGKVYDYGSASVISKKKYTHNCGVCDGRGRCGVCDGKGYF